MQTQRVRTTVDLREDLYMALREVGMRQGKTLKRVLDEAGEMYLRQGGVDVREIVGRMRKFAKKGDNTVNLVEFLRRDRDTRN